MHLKSLTLKGFKSFASATTLAFEPGICAVVGPNGSGKSNVVDALAWVMGEQGAKTLRGGSMQDVIFAGAGDRKPLGRAEVTLTIDNRDGALDIDYTEVSITRRMFRDGASEYEINGSRARLMDIQELLSDSGIGREMHIIVGQGRLSEILASRPEERRAYIEEAAGVLKHRRRKEKAQRKLVNMQANVDRLQDLTQELSRQLGPLARQATAASKAQTVQAELRQIKHTIAAADVQDRRLALEQEEQARSVAQAQLEDTALQLRAAQEAHAAAEEHSARLNPEVDRHQRSWFELSSLLERVTATGRIAADREKSITVSAYVGRDPEDLERRADEAAEVQQQLDEEVAMAAERVELLHEDVAARQEAAQAADREHMARVRAIADRREGVVRLVAQRESVQQRLAAGEDNVDRLQAEHEEAMAALTAAEENLAHAEEEAAARRGEYGEEEAKKERAIAERKEAEARLEQVRATERALEKDCARVEATIAALQAHSPWHPAADHGSLQGAQAISEFVQVEPSYDRAVAAALGPLATALVPPLDAADTGGPAGAAMAELIEQLCASEVARTALITSTPANEKPWRLDIPVPAGCSWLLDHIEAAAGVSAAVTVALVDVVVAPDVPTAVHVVSQEPRLRAVTVAGTVLGHGWAQVGSAEVSPVETAAQIRQATQDAQEYRARLDSLAGTISGAAEAAEQARLGAAAATAAVKERAAREKTLVRQVQAAQQAQHSAAQRLAKLGGRLAAAEEKVRSDAAELVELSERLARVDGEHEQEEADSTERDRAAEALNQVSALEMEARLALRTAQERARSHQGKAEQLRRQAAQERQAHAAHQRTMVIKAQEKERAAAIAHWADVVADRTKQAATAAKALLDRLVGQRQAVNQEVARLREELSTAQQAATAAAEAAHSCDVRYQQALVRCQETTARVESELAVGADQLLEQYAELLADFDRQDYTQRLHKAERSLRALGKVNPLALEEYKALQERYEFLSTQLADVEKARADLREVIVDVDKRILQLFTDAWEDVERIFPQVFATLFPGGEGKLFLTAPEDMLTTGIEIEARPPGKRVKRLSLLSGGEKSLTALALLVAIFQARPSPFYVLDEVEAALDDVNLRRLIALLEQLRENSQLIVITHQKPTMDVANVLYGVTMRGDGVTKVISQRMEPHRGLPDDAAAAPGASRALD